MANRVLFFWGNEFYNLTTFYDDQAGVFITDEFSIDENNAVFIRSTADGTLTSGLPATSPGIIVENAISPYSFCQGTTKIQFRASQTFPYAVVVETPDSTDCGFTFDPEIHLSYTVTDESGQGAEDGEINVFASSYLPVRDYTLFDSQGTQLAQVITNAISHIFDGLAAGTYTITVSNTGNATASVIVIVGVENLNNYGLFAIAESDTTHLKKPYSLKIYKKGYEGVVRTACMDGDSPIMIYKRGSKSPMIVPYVIGTSVDFVLIAESLRDWTILYTQDDREYLIEVELEGVLEFRGYLLPEFSEQDYTPIVHNARFTATDGLGQLKDYSFYRTNGLPYSGEYTLWQILKICVGKINVALELYDDIAYKIAGETGNLLKSEKVDAQVFYKLFPDPKCSDVVTAILKRVQGVLSQERGVLYISQPYNELESELLPDLALPRYSISSDRIAVGEDNIVVVDSSSISVEPGIQNVKTTEKLLPFDGLVKNSNFQDFTKWTFQPGTLNIGATVQDWFGTGALEFRKSTYPGLDLFFKSPQEGFVFRNARLSFAETKAIKAFSAVLKPEDTDLTSFLLYIKFSIKKATGPLRFRIAVKYGGLYLSEDSRTWTLTAEYPYYTSVDGGADLEISIRTPDLPDRIAGAAYPDGYPVEVWIYEPYTFKTDQFGIAEYPGTSDMLDEDLRDSYNNGQGVVPNSLRLRNALVIKQVQLKPQINGAELVSEQSITTVSEGEYTTRSITETLELGSNYGGNNAELYYPWSPRKVSDNSATIRYTSGETDNTDAYTLVELANRTLVKARKIPREILKATVFGYFNLAQRLKLTLDNDLVYFCSEYSFDVKDDTYNATFVYVTGEFPRGLFLTYENGDLIEYEEGGPVAHFEQNYTYDEFN